MRKVVFSISIIILAVLFMNDNYGQKMKSKSERDFEGINKGSTLQKTHAQIIDSLKNELDKAKDDTSKVNLTITLSSKYSTLNYDSSLNYVNISLKLSDSIKWKKGLANGYYQLGNIQIRKMLFDQAVQNFEKSIEISKQIDYKGRLGYCFIGIANVKVEKKDYEQAKKYFHEAIRSFKELKNEYEELNSYSHFGTMYKSIRNYDSAIVYFHKAYILAEKKNYLLSLATACMNLGNIYSQIQNLHEALNYYNKSLEISIDLGDNEHISGNYSNIGSIYMRKGESMKAIEYLEKALNIIEETGNKVFKKITLTNLANVYRQMSNFNKAVEYYYKANRISEEIKDYYGLCYNYLCLGDVHLKFEIDKSIVYYQKGLELLNTTGSNHLEPYYYNGMGSYYFLKKKFDKGIEYREKAINAAERNNDKYGLACFYGDIGSDYNEIGKVAEALKYLFNSSEIFLEIGYINGLGANYINIGNAYQKLACDSVKNLNDSTKKFYYSKAIEYYNKASEIFISVKSQDGISESLIEISKVYQSIGDYKTALEKYKEGKVIKDSVFSSENLKKIAELEAKKDLEIKEKENELLKQNAVLKESELARRNQELANLGNQQKIQKLELDKRNLDILSKNNELSLLSKDKELQTVTIKQKEAEQQKSRKEIEFLNKEKDYQGVVRRSLFGGIGLMSVLALLLFLFFWRKKRDNKKLEQMNIQIYEQKEIIEVEREKLDNLLLNVLPATIAERLKNGETAIADNFEEASVVFIDIVDFTKNSAGTDPKSVLNVLNQLYTKLDKIAQKHGLEKIKTIGDCYMAAAGVPEIRKDNAEMAAGFAMEAMKILKDYDTGGGLLINFRCGIDCGPVVAGVIGENKFIYDIWGDTVNTAARMEEYSEPGRIQVSEKFKRKLKNSNPLIPSDQGTEDTFSPLEWAGGGFFFEERGEIEVKGKGMMKTYFLTGNF